MWSLIIAGSPIVQSSRNTPAPFVSTATRHPSAAAARTPCTTGATPWPSYRCVRPVSTSTRDAPIVIDTASPPCPSADGFLNPGTSLSGQRSPSPSMPTASAQPEPSTATTWCSPPKRERRSSAARAARSNGVVIGGHRRRSRESCRDATQVHSSPGSSSPAASKPAAASRANSSSRGLSPGARALSFATRQPWRDE